MKEAEKLAGCVVKRSYPQCSCPCASGNLQLPRDFVVVVDSSASISRTDFGKVKYALDNLLTNQCHFSSSCIGRDITRLALIAYSSHVHVVTNFKTFANNHTTPNKLKTLILRISYLGGETRTEEALLKVKDEIFNVSAGMRLNSKKTILVLTYGGAVSKQFLHHYPGVNTIGLVIRQNVSVLELEKTTHHRNCLVKNTILVAGFENLLDIIEAIIELSGDCKLICS